ncbi:MAG: MerR family transcriptional regulator [Actinomycetota bacterium]
MEPDLNEGVDLEGDTEGFRGPQVCKIVGISYRQLDYWARTKLVEPSLRAAQGSGSQRLYSFADLVDLKLIKNLLGAGVSLQRVRDAIDYLHAIGHDLSGVTIASDGTSVYACKSPEEVFDLLRGGQGVFGIAVDPVMQELKGSVLALRDHKVPAQPAAGESTVTELGKAAGKE